MEDVPCRPDFAAVRAAEYPRANDTDGSGDGGAYLNAASFGPLPERSRRAVDAFNRRRQEIRRLGEDDLVETAADARSAIARLIGAEPGEIALGPNTSCGLNLAAKLLRRRLDDRSGTRRVVLSDREFPANVYPWMALRRAGELEVDRVPTDRLGRPREEALLERLAGDDVALFTISAVQFASGHRADLARFGRVCRERDILFVVDGIQALGAVPIDMREAHIDILACGGQKWLCGPFGSGFAYVREELCRASEPPLPGWGAFESSTDFSSLLDYDYDLLPDARRFEVGSLGLQDYLGLTHSIELLLELGIYQIRDHIRAVQEPVVEWALGRDDVEIVSSLAEEDRSAILCIRPPHAERVHERLADAGIVCVLREGAIRLSPHWYNTPEQMERVVDVMAERVESRGAAA